MPRSFGSVTLLGAAWIGLGLAHLVLIRELPEHGVLVLYTVVIAVFASDTAAYGAGRVLGRHKMAPETSPGKTWEGFVAGAVVALLVPFFAFYEENLLTVPESLAVGAVIAVAGPVGDLFESAVKRTPGSRTAGGFCSATAECSTAGRIPLHGGGGLLSAGWLRSGMIR